MNNDAYFLGLLVREIRTSYGLTQRELAAQIDKSEVALRKYESGDVKIPFSVLFTIVHLMGVTAEDLNLALDKITLEAKLAKILDDTQIEICIQKTKFMFDRLFKGFGYNCHFEFEFDAKAYNERASFEFIYQSIYNYTNRIVEIRKKEDNKKIVVTPENVGNLINDIIKYLNFRIDDFYTEYNEVYR